MLEIFLKTLPFFLVIGTGWAAGKTRFFPAEATAWLTKFVFYFALSAMLLRFSAAFPLSQLLDWNFLAAYLLGTATVYAIGLAAAFARRRPLSEAAFEAQCAASGNTGFLGLPLLAVLLGPEALGPNMMVLAVDMIVFSSLIVILVTAAREGRVRLAVLGAVGMGLLKNPMIVSLVAGFAWAATGWPVPGPVNSLLTTLGAAATPGALFAIGASLASKSAERLAVAAWLSFAKLVLHPAIVAVCALLLFPVEPYAAGVMIAAAALPVAGNVYILAAHYGVAPLRVSAAILVSTALSVVTVTTVVAWVKTGL